MLDSLRLENFKAWRELDVQFGKVTGLFGGNSSGKSSLLQILLMLKQTKNATDRGLVVDFGDANGLVNLGTFSDVVYKHDQDARIRWRLGWRLTTDVRVGADLNPQGGALVLGHAGDRVYSECSIGVQRSRLMAHSLRYALNDYAFALEQLPDKPAEYRLVSESENFQFVRNRGRAWPLPGPIKTHLFPDQVRAFFQNTFVLGELEYGYEQTMDNIYYLGPLREYPKREYGWAGARPDDVGQRGEHTVDAILAATAQGDRQNIAPRHRLMMFQELVAYWLKELGLIESFSIRELAEGSNLYRAWVKRDRYSAEVLLTEVGFGVSQILPVLVLLSYVPEGSTILMEQPEIHLHPSVQSGLADFMLWAARKRNVQIIVESHSEHLLRRFQRRVAENEFSSEDVRLYFSSVENGVASLDDLELNEWGEIQNWPNNFFGDELGELSAITISSLQRKISSQNHDG